MLPGILLPLAMGMKDPASIAISFSLIWTVHSFILLEYVFPVEGRRNRNRSNSKKEENPFAPKLVQEWGTLWKITVGRRKDSGMGNPNWNRDGNLKGQTNSRADCKFVRTE
jgi:hypothetical protein